MLSNAVGSAPLMRRRAFHRPLAALALPFLLAACVSHEGGLAGVAEIGAAPALNAEAQEAAGETADVAAALPTERPDEAESDADTPAITALAPEPARPGQNGTISGSSAIDRMIEAAAAEHGVPRELAFAVVHVESRYNPRAKGAGVYGLSQIKPATARSMGFSGSAEDLFDPATNLKYGMRYLKGAWEKGGRDICEASLRYKGGHRATRMTRSTQVYCANVKRHIASITGQPASSQTLVASAVAAPVASAIAPREAPRSAASAAIAQNQEAAAAVTLETGAETAAQAAREEETVAEVAALEPVAPSAEEHAAAPSSPPEAEAAGFEEPDSARFGN